jgi:hypothetical protein
MKRSKLIDREDITEIFRGSEMASQQNRKAVSQYDSLPAKKPRGMRVKVTFYLEEDDITVLERERFNRRTLTGRRRGISDLSSLVREAIRKTYGAPE